MEIENVGKEAPVETNDRGGKQSVTSYAMHLVDPSFLANVKYFDDSFIDRIAIFMSTGLSSYLREAYLVLENQFNVSIFTIAKVLKEGAEKYAPNNWRLIPQEEHLNHCLIHYLAYKEGNREDDHIAHCACRLMMVYATQPTDGFQYIKPFKGIY